MARQLSEIYEQAKLARSQYLELTEFENDSKMSILDAFTWTTSACIWAFENILDVFKVDLVKDLQNRVNGTAGYYASALLKYQSGDQLQMNEEGTAFHYPSQDTSKRIITKVSYSEFAEDGYHDKKLLLKVATGTPGQYQSIDRDELVAIQAYVDQISFAGTHSLVVSRKGDVLIPRVTVYYDGAVPPEEVYNNIETCLNEFLANLPFNGLVYVQRIIDAIQSAEHVVDVYISPSSSDQQGFFVAQYDDNDNLIEVQPDVYEKLIDRCFVPNSGFMKQSTGTGDESTLPTWRETIALQIERE